MANKTIIIGAGGSPKKSGFPSSGGGVGTSKVKISETDETEDYLSNKIVGKDRIWTYINDDLPSETLEIYGGDHFTIPYVNYDYSLGAGDFLAPGSFYIQNSGNGMGFFSDDGFIKLHRIQVLLHKFVTNQESSVSIRVERYNANGNKPSVFSPGQGNIIATATYNNVPNTSGSTLYYQGFGGEFNAMINPTGALFVYISSSTVSFIDGISVWLHMHKTPLIQMY